MSKARGLASFEKRFKVKIQRTYQRDAERSHRAHDLYAKAAEKRARKAAKRKADQTAHIESVDAVRGYA